MSTSFDGLSDAELARVAERFLSLHAPSPGVRNRIQDLLWADSSAPEIPKRFRREVARALDRERIYLNAQRFDDLLDRRWILDDNPLAFIGGVHGTSASDSQSVRAMDVKVTEDELTVDLEDGRTLAVPLAWYPRLAHGRQRARSRWRLIGRGRGIHWPDLDEDISVEGLLAGRRSSETQESLKRWLATRVSNRSRKRREPTERKTRRG